MWVLGLTGGIGSGKSVASDYFTTLGILVVDADVCARTVVAPGKPALEKIAAHFGTDVLLDDGTLNRRLLRERIFSNPAEKSWLEGLLHPLIREEIVGGLHQSHSPYAILVSPLLMETDQRQLVQRVLLIDVPENLQVERAVKRDQASAESIRAIMATQKSRASRLALADDIVVNDQDIDALKAQLAPLHEHYLLLAEEAQS